LHSGILGNKERNRANLYQLVVCGKEEKTPSFQLSPRKCGSTHHWLLITSESVFAATIVGKEEKKCVCPFCNNLGDSLLESSILSTPFFLPTSLYPYKP
jgi:hypothetical protein